MIKQIIYIYVCIYSIYIYNNIITRQYPPFRASRRSTMSWYWTMQINDAITRETVKSHCCCAGVPQALALLARLSVSFNRIV